MKKIAFFIATMATLAGCVQEVPPPANLLPEETMVALLVDLHETEMRISTQNWNKRVGYEVYKKFEKEIFQQYGTDSATYAMSFNYYVGKVDKFAEVYQVVIDSLEARANLLDPEREKKIERGIIKN